MEGPRQVSPASPGPSKEPIEERGGAEAESYFRVDDLAGQLWNLIVQTAADADLFRQVAERSEALPVQLRLDIERTGLAPIQLSLDIEDALDENENQSASRSADL